jgi:hypothetical protein
MRSPVNAVVLPADFSTPMKLSLPRMLPRAAGKPTLHDVLDCIPSLKLACFGSAGAHARRELGGYRQLQNYKMDDDVSLALKRNVELMPLRQECAASRRIAAGSRKAAPSCPDRL